jgi:hypothetical protein
MVKPGSEVFIVNLLLNHLVCQACTLHHTGIEDFHPLLAGLGFVFSLWSLRVLRETGD